MISAHALALTQARSCVAALADQAETADASSEYERVLLQLDGIHGDDVPAQDGAGFIADRCILHLTAEFAIEQLTGYGVDALQVEIVLDMLHAARARDAS